MRTLTRRVHPYVEVQVWQEEAQAKAAKHCSTENRQQEAQAMAA